MSAPVIVRPRGAAIPAPRRAPRTEQQESGSAKRAYARRDERLRRLVGGTRPARSSTAPPRRAQFVTLVMGLLGVGLVLTLWLSTAAAADSYRLQDARDATGTLTEQAEALRREVAVADSATELARRATQLGMVPVRDSARLVVAPDGSVAVVGDPTVATVPAPVLPPAPPQEAPPADAPAVPDPAVPDPAVPDPADADPADPTDPADPADPAELAAADPAAADPDGPTPAAD